MGTHQHFCLRWNNHQSNFLSVFDDLLKHETLVDVTLACEGLSLKAHKVVLSACSPYFQHLFLDNPCKHPIVILKDIKFMDMKTLIDFMYKGEVNVSHDQLSTLLRVADTLKVKGLAEVTENMALQGTEMAAPQTVGTIPQPPPPPQQQQHVRPDPSINSVSPPPKRRKKSRKTSGGSNGHSDDVDSGGANNTFGQVMTSAEMRSDVVPKNESSEQNYDNTGLLKSCAVGESTSRSGGLSRGAASASQQANISQESSSHTHSYTNKNSLEVPQMYESSGGEMEADVPYRSSGMQHLSGRQDESTSSPNPQAHLPSTSSSSHADQPEYFSSTADATAPSTSRTSNSQGHNASLVVDEPRNPKAPWTCGISGYLDRINNRRNRRSFSVAYKLRVVQEAEKIGIREASEKFNIRLDSILQWLLKKSSLQTTLEMFSGRRRKYVRKDTADNFFV